ncbi:translation initiation factor 2 [Sporosarcina aquimarina]|uniref:Translation initiation factor 2 n=1 Tax=Sporosarcina aquimarina TaxID=114975 RepID=A0ABU4G3G8_9BACL|nr:translation initiation factor 2 [Sporosarcina aquimarina]MDW0111507.1 translation initiation factor 2 [Sporosarcina aquimarina]
MYDSNNTPQGQDTPSPEIFAARIGFFGALLSTLGDGLQSIGAGIVLKQLENPSSPDTQIQSDHTTQIESMQKQIDLLTKKIDEMDRKE